MDNEEEKLRLDLLEHERVRKELELAEARIKTLEAEILLRRQQLMAIQLVMKAQ